MCGVCVAYQVQDTPDLHLGRTCVAGDACKIRHDEEGPRKIAPRQPETRKRLRRSRTDTQQTEKGGKGIHPPGVQHIIGANRRGELAFFTSNTYRDGCVAWQQI